nr:Down syndrome cell adhesion molecule-like protein Dscam2 [Drosophila bipectinata]
MVASGRAKTKDGTLIILAVLKIDKGDFFCTVTNSEGTEIFKLELSVTSPLSTIIEPSIQTVSLGHTADLICRTFGFPQQNIVWLKDGNILRTGSRVRLLSNERIHFSPIIKEDKGMYQCVLKNDWEYTQSSAEFRLGEVSPHFNYKFIEQTLQPGHFISLKCSCSGNPTPNIIWFLDGYTLPKSSSAEILAAVASPPESDLYTLTINELKFKFSPRLTASVKATDFLLIDEERLVGRSFYLLHLRYSPVPCEKVCIQPDGEFLDSGWDPDPRSGPTGDVTPAQRNKFVALIDFAKLSYRSFL